jgi:hypothetical protein
VPQELQNLDDAIEPKVPEKEKGKDAEKTDDKKEKDQTKSKKEEDEK